MRNRVRIGLRSIFALALLLTVTGGAANAQEGRQARGLDIYFIDTEGGQSTLMVTPAGESVLIDSGNPGTRDAERIYRVAAKVAGLKQIDHSVVTHWHLDHYGGHGRLAELMPIKRCYDHGIPDKSIDDPEHFPALIAAYKKVCGGKSTTLNAGDLLPLQQAAGAPRLRMVTLVGMQTTVPDREGRPQNPQAANNKPAPPDPSDNANSLGFRLSYGGWRFVDFGDITWNIEYKLIAPTDKIGPVDVYLTTHHGLEISNNPVLINTIKPVVAIFNNGPRKGGHPDVTKTLRAVSGLKDIWMLHRNVTCDPAMNAPKDRTANWEETCEAEFIKLSVAADARSYTVQIGKRGQPVHYETRRRPRQP